MTEPYKAGYAKKGSGYFFMSQSGENKNVQVEFGHGHSKLSFAPSISLTGAGISFSIDEVFATIATSQIN